MSKHELRDEIDRLIQELKHEAGVINEEISSLEKVAKVLDKRYGLSTDSRTTLQNDLDRYKGLPELEIVLRFASEHNGDMETKTLTKIFERKVKNPKNAGPAVFTIIGRLVKQKKAIKIRKGLYRLTDGTKSQATE